MIKLIYYRLQDKPVIGIASGIGSGAVIKAQNFLTDDQVLKVVAALAAWAGLFVACCTAIVWAIKAYKAIKSFRNPKTPTNEEVI